ncbi:1-phosphofructokinase family hexose kinase [Glutamicibacter arilaitensis]|uniref:1-phosphofructokinase family hexose kinase n=1 Tax=Glutamicibacter arilaitensis TaxID=256701 RepID=UPI00384ED466
MIITLTCNPALDKTIELIDPLARGAVQRAAASHTQAAGKGVNVSRAIAIAGAQSLALLPGAIDDPLIAALRGDGLEFKALPIDEPLRTNVTITDPDGTTTKINESGPVLTADSLAALSALVLDSCAGAQWLVMAGSLPPGAPADFYAKLTAALRDSLGVNCPKIAVDTSGEPMRQLFAHGPSHVPDLIKPNAEELAELVGTQLTEEQLENSAELTASTCQGLLELGAGAVLATLGAQGAVLATGQGAWHGWHQPISVRSTVGAGDSSLAGYLLAVTTGAAPDKCLGSAIAYGAAATSLPGSTIPAPSDLTVDAVTVVALNPRQGS